MFFSGRRAPNKTLGREGRGGYAKGRKGYQCLRVLCAFFASFALQCFSQGVERRIKRFDAKDAKDTRRDAKGISAFASSAPSLRPLRYRTSYLATGPDVFGSSDDAALAQAGDVGVGVAELAQDLVAVLAELGAGGFEPARRAAQRHRLADQAGGAEQRMLDRLGDAEMLYLRVGKYLVDRVDRAGGHAGAVEPVDPFGAVALPGDRLDRRIERLAVLRAQPAGLVVGVVGELGR